MGCRQRSRSWRVAGPAVTPATPKPTPSSTIRRENTGSNHQFPKFGVSQQPLARPPQVGRGLTLEVADSSGVADIPAIVRTSMERDLPLTLIRAATGIFFSKGRILVCHSSRRGSGYSV